MKSYKTNPISPEESRKVQEKAFRLGWSWFNGENGKNVHCSDMPFLYFHSSGRITWSDRLGSFSSFENEYITPADFLALPEPIPDKAPILCRYDILRSSAKISFWDDVNKCSFDHKGGRNGIEWDHYERIPESTMDTLWPDWREVQKELGE